ncbi:MAG: sulfotransferase [Lachnospiraceae bacterium]|nr:sulfotransferase [Lachnospiraceae bacterium]
MAKVNFAHNLLGCRFDNWLRLRRENPITDKRQGRFITLVSLILGLPALLEWLIFYIPINRTVIEKDPVYIVGYWRSGTTFLQNLLTRDPQYAWFDPVRTLTFSNCILLKPLLARIQKNLLKDARPMDNMEYALDLPMEEVFAQATISTQAISHMLSFPDGGRGVKFFETAFIDEQDEEKQQEWRKAYSYILRKVTYLNKGKQLLLKSPENTCRLGELKRCYPGAKFINIYRNPYKVVMSAINMFEKEMDLLCLDEPASPETIENVAIDMCARVYRKAIRELESMPQADHIDICYEDFCKDPMGYTKKIYEELELPGFEEAKPYFEEYLESQKDYQKNIFSLEPELRDKVNSRLDFYFQYYGYEMITE